MEESQLNDLKQFISATVSQATANMATKDDIAGLSTRVDSLENKVDSLESKIDDLDLKVDTISDALNEQLTDHDTRLTKLEQQTV